MFRAFWRLEINFGLCLTICEASQSPRVAYSDHLADKIKFRANFIVERENKQTEISFETRLRRKINKV